jgi:hypothetical protein
MKKTKRRLVLGVIIVLIATMGGLTFLFHKGKKLKNTDEFVQELKSRNYVIDSIEDVPTDKVRWFSGSQKVINGSNMELSVFEFGSEKEAITEAGKVSNDGFKIKEPANKALNTQNGVTTPMVAYISWSDNPHFYRSGSIIVLYCGTNLKVQYDLNRILGSQFAGLKWYIPGRKH